MDSLAPIPELAPLRGFGTRANDLHVDLTAAPPRAITELLACCSTREADCEALWELPVGRRIEGLLAVLALSGTAELDVDLHCAGCGASFEVTLAVEEFLHAGPRPGDKTVPVAMDDGIRWFRRPTGRDQLTWLERSFADDAAMAAELAASLAVETSDSPLPLAAIEAALDEADPLLRAPLRTACPECGREAEVEVDLTGMSLARLRRCQDRLLAEVDLLASRYHWSEAEILGLPAWRRAWYVEMLQRAAHV